MNTGRKRLILYSILYPLEIRKENITLKLILPQILHQVDYKTVYTIGTKHRSNIHLFEQTRSTQANIYQ